MPNFGKVMCGLLELKSFGGVCRQVRGEDLA